MTDRIEKIRQRAEAATQGPWRAYGNTVEQENTGCHQVVGTELTGVGYMAYERLTTKNEDATFIAHAREDIPYLLAEVERLRAALTLACRDGWSDGESATTHYIEKSTEWLATTEGDES